MEQPVAIHFRWTAEEMSQAYSYHFRHTCRPAFRVGLNFLFGVILAGGVLMIISSGPSGKAPLPVSIGFLLVGIYWFALRQPVRRWSIRREFAKRPDKDLELEWQITPERLAVKCTAGSSEQTWQLIRKVVRTPVGILLYSTEQIYNWLPRHGFSGDSDFERLSEIAKSKVQRFYHVV
jgi:hypothetical protein